VRRVLGVGLVALAAVLGGPTALRLVTGIHETSSLPHRIYMCDRDWTEDASAKTWSGAEIGGQTTGDPVIVNPGPFGLLTACPFPAGATVDTVVYVRVDLDGYVDYSLSGGP
jgi:hypothetical protein